MTATEGKENTSKCIVSNAPAGGDFECYVYIIG